MRKENGTRRDEGSLCLYNYVFLRDKSVITPKRPSMRQMRKPLCRTLGQLAREYYNLCHNAREIRNKSQQFVKNITNLKSMYCNQIIVSSYYKILCVLKTKRLWGYNHEKRRKRKKNIRFHSYPGFQEGTKTAL